MIKEAVKSLPKGDETVETTADQLRQEGIQIGEAKGIQSFIQELRNFSITPIKLKHKYYSML